MKYQMTVDGVLVADYYNVEKALDHTFVALEDDRFVSVTLVKINDDGSTFVPGGQEATNSPVEVPAGPEVPLDENGNHVEANPVSSDPTQAAPVQL